MNWIILSLTVFKNVFFVVGCGVYCRWLLIMLISELSIVVYHGRIAFGVATRLFIFCYNVVNIIYQIQKSISNC